MLLLTTKQEQDRCARIHRCLTHITATLDAREKRHHEATFFADADAVGTAAITRNPSSRTSENNQSAGGDGLPVLPRAQVNSREFQKTALFSLVVWDL